MLNFCEGMQGLCRDSCNGNLWKPRYKKFSVLQKNEQDQGTVFDFRKVVISNSLPDELRDLHTSKHKRPHNRPHDTYLLKRNKVRTSKQLRFFASAETFNGN